jgi:hypothetical protein
MGVRLEAFTVDRPAGERREVVARSYVDGRAQAALDRFRVVLGAAALAE